MINEYDDCKEEDVTTEKTEKIRLCKDLNLNLYNVDAQWLLQQNIFCFIPHLLILKINNLFTLWFTNLW